SEAHFQVVKIWDQGLGITPAELPNLFERFYQGNSDRQAQGSGLGLYLTRQIIEAHGGIIWAENKIPITSGTVRSHVHAIFQKLEVRDRTQAAILAIQKGLVNKPL
ncbi:MAG: ATP-binding protein, partial [Planktothrix sp.]